MKDFEPGKVIKYIYKNAEKFEFKSHQRTEDPDVIYTFGKDENLEFKLYKNRKAEVYWFELTINGYTYYQNDDHYDYGGFFNQLPYTIHAVNSAKEEKEYNRFLSDLSNIVED